MNFAAQQTSNFRAQNLEPFYSKFRAELNAFISSVQIGRGRGSRKRLKNAKTKLPMKNARRMSSGV